MAEKVLILNDQKLPLKPAKCIAKIGIAFTSCSSNYPIIPKAMTFNVSTHVKRYPRRYNIRN
jgi:hypothetical protein